MTKAQSPLIQFASVSFAYGDKVIIDNFDWQTQQGEFWAILGPSGSGKTTLLYLISGLRQAQTGNIRITGQAANSYQNIGLMLQDYGLLPWYSVEHNIRIALRIRNVAKHLHEVRIRTWLERLGIADIRHKYPGQTSGGQRQRTALARVLALEPQVLLLDEPLSAVDELTREKLQQQLYSLTREQRISTIMVTHNIEEAALLADKVMVIGKQQPISSYQVFSSPFAALPSRDDPVFSRFTRELRSSLT